jgi:hypothetical protein
MLSRGCRLAEGSSSTGQIAWDRVSGTNVTGRACPGARTAGAQALAGRHAAPGSSSRRPSRRAHDAGRARHGAAHGAQTRRHADTDCRTSHLALSRAASPYGRRHGLTCCLHVSCESLQAPKRRPSWRVAGPCPGGTRELSYHGGPQQRACCPIHRHRGKPLQNLPSAMLCRSVDADSQSLRNGLCSVQTPMQVPICTTAHQSKHCRHSRRCAVMPPLRDSCYPRGKAATAPRRRRHRVLLKHRSIAAGLSSTGGDSCLGCAVAPRENTTQRRLVHGRICMRLPTHSFAST